jgi:DNA-binding NarL/FixJ family response regulator
VGADGLPDPRPVERPARAATVLIVDDHTLFRQGLESLIARWDDFEVVGSVGSGREGIREARRLEPDLILMDVRMGDVDGIEATRRICARDRRVRVVMLTVSGLGEDLFQALRVGAWGYLGKDEPAERLHANLQGVMRGETVLSSAAANMALGELGLRSPHDPRQAPSANLTSREKDVLTLLVDGLSNEEIADALHVSEATVKKHLGSVMVKLHLKNRVQVAVRALRDGIVD